MCVSDSVSFCASEFLNVFLCSLILFVFVWSYLSLLSFSCSLCLSLLWRHILSAWLLSSDFFSLGGVCQGWRVGGVQVYVSQNKQKPVFQWFWHITGLLIVCVCGYLKISTCCFVWRLLLLLLHSSSVVFCAAAWTSSRCPAMLPQQTCPASLIVQGTQNLFLARWS